MTRDCGHTTGDDQRLQTFGETTLDRGTGRMEERVLHSKAERPPGVLTQ
ncbi:unnamed protein product, partial [Staurois parvus]